MTSDKVASYIVLGWLMLLIPFVAIAGLAVSARSWSVFFGLWGLLLMIAGVVWAYKRLYRWVLWHPWWWVIFLSVWLCW